MSNIDDAFDQSRIDFGLQQKPNWNGIVYGVCKTKGCPQNGKVGYYTGGFCKKCSYRHPDDRKQYATSGHHPNPKVRWLTKMYVKDLSHMLSGSERAEFYMTPEQLIRRQDRVDYEEPQDEDWFED